VAKEFTVTLLRGLITFLFLAAVARGADLCPFDPAPPASAAFEQATSEQLPGLTVQSDSEPVNFAAKSEEGSACQSLKPKALKIGEIGRAHV